MNRERFLVVRGVSPERWAERYGMEPFDLACSECGAVMTTSIPFAFETLRGLLAPACACGNADTPYCVVREYGAGDLFTGAEAASPRKQAETRMPSQAHQLLRLAYSSDG